MNYDKPDAVKAELVTFLRSLGFSYRDLPQTRKGQPDGLLGLTGKDGQVEFKSGKEKLKPDQAAFAAAWKGTRVAVLRTRQDCLDLLYRW